MYIFRKHIEEGGKKNKPERVKIVAKPIVNKETERGTKLDILATEESGRWIRKRGTKRNKTKKGTGSEEG